ncbi:hypothetical protein DTO006G1_1682 [Penicillium roqueforti]|nr:hypothetical protein CBS147337_6470 [Penicillium roqueforti]KAI2763341.1 hypothetical protein DTO006G1_1682 [Penicillium roqueforti]KAI3252631.1 hypothetical protein DTO006G7_6806 [Penicillium roqueforti]KAI3274441.1 hypothetical protein CBS147309_4345 [Penicillium roqueforti]
MPISQSEPMSENWMDRQAGITLGNGQLRLKIHNWRTPTLTFAIENNPNGNLKCDLEAGIENSEIIRVDFRIPINYPDGMMGIMGSIEALFECPKRIAMSNIETGPAPALRESKNMERHSYHIKWTTPWETSSCQVSWMKAKEKLPTMKFKFVSGRIRRPVEQMIVTVDGRDKFYQKISKKDPNTYGKWMAYPVQIWLRIQWLMSRTKDIDNKLFDKLLVDETSRFSIQKKIKGNKASKKSPKRVPEHSTVEEENSEEEKPDASVMSHPEQSLLGREHTIETMGSQKSTQKQAPYEEATQEEATQHKLSHELNQYELTEQESAQHEATQKELTKKVSALTIDTQKSNKRYKGKCKGKGKGKCTPGLSSSNTGKRDVGKKNVGRITDRITEQRGSDQHGSDQRGDLLPGVHGIALQEVPIKQQLAAVASQQTQTISDPVFPTTPNDLTAPLSPSFETARTHLSPRTYLPLSTMSSFCTPTSALWRIDEDDGEESVKAEENEPAATSDELFLTPQGGEAGLRCPVSNNRDKVWFSDPEEYHGDHEAQEPVLHRSESFSVASLGLYRGQEMTSSSQTTDPPLTPRASSALSTTDSAEFGIDDPSSDGAIQPYDQTSAESSRPGKRIVYKKKKQGKRKLRELMKRQQARDADVELPVSPASSQTNGMEGHSPSPPELSEDNELTPTVKQFGNTGAPPPGLLLDLRTLGVTCHEPFCEALCCLGVGVSVVCPKCGPFSLVRYCGKDHLWEDAKRHWVVCTQLPVLEQCLASSISHDLLVGPPMLPNLHQWDKPERHRQALWFSSARDRGDYFVFAEWDDLVKVEDDPASHLQLRCSPRIAHIVRFENAEEKDRFRRCLAICLFAAIEHPALVDYLYRLVRDWMRAHNMWASDKDMDSMLRYQMGLEMGGAIDQSRLGLRHACETEWIGADRRHCGNLICASERRPTLLGNHDMGLGFRKVCESLESKYWILRAHRATHPSVSDVVARTRGGGFPGVLSEDRRTFHRGIGWDGVGAGPMELEMPGSG